jgi:hypothetical protein
MPKADEKTEDPEYPTDLLYGLLSVVNQFGGVLRERGQEYRTSRVGKLLGERIENMYRGINERERNILDVVLTSLDELASTIRNLDADLHGPNGSSTNGNGAKPPGANGHDAEKDRRKKTRRHSKVARDGTSQKR